jgi:hypothetical protein
MQLVLMMAEAEDKETTAGTKLAQVQKQVVAKANVNDRRSYNG